MSTTINNQQTIEIHPAIDFTTEKAYLSQKISSLDGINIYLIRNDNKKTQYTTRNIEAFNIQLTHTDFSYNQRWSTQNINSFIRKTINPPTKTELFELIKNKFLHYLEIRDSKIYDLLTIWNIGTYFYRLFNTYPYIYIGGISQSGKSKLLMLSSCICFNSVPSANMSTAVLYRLIQNARCSLFIDETEFLSNWRKAGDFRNILLNGYKKGLDVFRTRSTPEGNFTAERFEVYSPKMIANISGLDSVLSSRCIPITLRRSVNRNISNREVNVEDQEWQQIRDKLYLFLMKYWKEIKQSYVDYENNTDLIGRNYELWKPIFSIVRFFEDSELEQRVKLLAQQISDSSQFDESEMQEFLLVETLLTYVIKDNYYRLKDLKNLFAEKFESSDWLTERHTGCLLRRLGFQSTRRMSYGIDFFLKISEVKMVAQGFGFEVDSVDSEHSVDIIELREGNCLDRVEVI